MGNGRKSSLAVVIGLLASMIVLTLLHLLNSKIFPTPEGINPKDSVAIKQAMAAMPFGANILLITSYFIASVVGGLVSTKIVNAESKNPALIVGSILTFFGLINSVTLGEPIWMAVCSFLMYVPGAYLGYKLLAPKS